MSRDSFAIPCRQYLDTCIAMKARCTLLSGRAVIEQGCR